MTKKNLERECRRRTTTTTTPVTIPPANGIESCEAGNPEFIRLPRSGDRCSKTGLSRASLNELILGSGAPVKSVVLRQEGATRGIRLIHLDSLLGYLHGEMESQADGVRKVVGDE